MSQLSGKFVVRMDPRLHKQLKEQSLNQGISLNQIVLSKIINSSNENAVLSKLQHCYGNRLIGVVLFGSQVRGEAKPSSDVDLLLIVKDTEPIERNLYRTWDAEVAPKIDKKISPQFSHLPQNLPTSSLWLEVALEGEIQFDPTGEVRKTLYKLKHLIAEGKAQRKVAHGHPYWVWEIGKSAE